MVVWLVDHLDTPMADYLVGYLAGYLVDMMGETMVEWKVVS